MSNLASKWVRTVTPPDIIAGAVLLYLANCHNDKTGFCFPSKQNIAAYFQCNLKTVEAALNRLKEKKLIDWRLGKSNKGSCNYYRFIGLDKFKENNKLDIGVTPSNDVTPSNGVTPSRGGRGNTVSRGTNLKYIEKYKEKEKSIKEKEKITPSNGTTPIASDCIDSLFDEAEVPITTESQKTKTKKPRQSRVVTFDFYTSLPDEWRQYSKEVRPDLEPEVTFKNMRFYYLSGKGKGTLKMPKNWSSTFQNWTRREKESIIKGSDSSVLAATDKANDFEVPVTSIVALYRKHLPKNPQCDFVDDSMRTNAAAFWKTMTRATTKCEKTKENVLKTITRFFVYVGKSPFLTGKTTEWKASLAWLLTPANTLKVINNEYHKE